MTRAQDYGTFLDMRPDRWSSPEAHLGWCGYRNSYGQSEQMRAGSTELEAELQDAREANQAMREAVQKSRGERCHRSYSHPAHGWMFARRAMQCPGVTDTKETL